MPSTYTVNLGIQKPATGEQSGTWGNTTNANFDILDQGINGALRLTLTSAGSSGSPNALAINEGTVSDGHNKWIEFYSSGDLGGNVFVQLTPNDAEKIVFVRNSLAGSRSVLLFQGTYNSGRDLEIPAGVDMVVKFSGGGAAAATVTDVYTKLRATEITTPSLTATTADINGGTIDNSVIGGSTAAAVTGTAIVANTSLNIAGDGATVTGIKDEDNMASNSATKLATQQSIKTYVDTQVATIPVGDITSVVAGTGLTGGGTTGDVTLNVIGGTGITANANDITIDATVATLTGTQTFTNKTLTSAVLNTSVTGTAVLDEDNMASNSATKLATQQSIKSYVDTQVATIPTGDITSVIAGTGLTGGGTSGAVTLNVTTLNQDTTGNAATATALQTARTIAGVSFNGTANISLNNNAITNGAGYTTNTGDITGVTAGTGLTGGGASGAVTLNLGTAGAGAGTYGSTSNTTKIDQITLDAYGRVTAVTTGATGDITGVTAGTQLTGGGTSGTVTLNVSQGAGSGLDADTLDGVQGASYLRSDTSDTFTGDLTVVGKITLSSADPEIFLTDTTTGVDHSIDGNSGVGNLFIHVDKNNEGSDPKFIVNVGSTDELIVATETGVDVTGDLSIPNKIIHSGDTDTYMQFHAADQFRVVTGGNERLEVNNSAVTVAGVLSVGSAIDLIDNKILRFGSSDDVEFFFNGSHMYTDLNLGDWYIRDGTTNRFLFNDNGEFSC